MASNYPTQVFDASYAITTGKSSTKTDMRMASDGKGHFYTETSAAGQKYGTNRQLCRRHFGLAHPPGQNGHEEQVAAQRSYVADESSIKQMNGKPIGSKSVNGHPFTVLNTLPVVLRLKPGSVMIAKLWLNQ